MNCDLVSSGVNKQNGRRINNKRIYKDVTKGSTVSRFLFLVVLTSSSVTHQRGQNISEVKFQGDEGRKETLDGGKLIVNFNSITRQEVNTRPQSREDSSTLG